MLNPTIIASSFLGTFSALTIILVILAYIYKKKIESKIKKLEELSSMFK